MTDEELFATPALQVLEPPPGGLDRIRATLEQRGPRWWWIAIPVAAAVMIAIVLAGRISDPRRAAVPAVARGAPLVADPTIASNDGTSFYWVASQAQPANPSIHTVTVETVDPIGQPPQVLIP